MYYRSMLSAVIATCLANPIIAKESSGSPSLVLAEQFHNQIDLSLYWVSEKYDGARAWWNGRHFLSRGGNIYHAPKWFTDNLPDIALDGELWIGRGRFQALMQTIRDHKPDDTAWKAVKFMVFDAPHADGHFSDRQEFLGKTLRNVPDHWIQQVPQQKISTHKALQSLLQQITGEGAEGLMLQKDGMDYLAGRHYGLLKFKTHTDAEAVVMSHLPGKGKYRNMLGSMVVEDSTGVQFKIGTGFSDEQRVTPPAIGTTITFRYQGRTQSGKPRFARFLRVRPEE